MEYLLGLLTGVVFLIAMGLSFYIGYKVGGQKKSTPSQVDEEEKQRIERFNTHFKDLFNYDVDKALQRKKVTE